MTQLQFIASSGGLAIGGKNVITNARSRKASESMLMGSPYLPRAKREGRIGALDLRRWRVTHEMETI